VEIADIVRVVLGTFVRPLEETGTGAPRVEAVYGYAVRHPDGLVLLDTGIGRGDAETEAWYRPQRIGLADALAQVGARLDEVTLAANCHLHFDHCGGNPQLGATPILCQRNELETARAGDYTFLDSVDFPGANYQLLDGDAEPLPGVHVIATPGHVAGHQSLIVECSDGSVVLAGQAFDTASLFSADVLAARASVLGHAAPLPAAAPWIDRLLAFDPRRVVFAHDAAVWMPS
jgi:N-acyl homoserine lactone hydrolase